MLLGRAQEYNSGACEEESTMFRNQNFKSSGMVLFTSYKLEDKAQELIFWSSGIEQNSPHTQEI